MLHADRLVRITALARNAESTHRWRAGGARRHDLDHAQRAIVSLGVGAQREGVGCVRWRAPPGEMRDHRQRGWRHLLSLRSSSSLDWCSCAVGQDVVGMVVCSHIFGVGVYLAEGDMWGHVNTPALAPDDDGEIVLPSIGQRLSLRVLCSGTGQVRLAGRDVRCG